MNFEDLVTSLLPKLKRLSFKYHAYSRSCDEEDLLSEMILFLWKKWRQGEWEDKTESYIVQACYFHMRNRLRGMEERCQLVNLDEPVDEDGTRVSEFISDNSQSMADHSEGNALYETIMNNGFSEKEKEVVRYLCEEYTVREIGEKLHISHAMVVKYKKNISKKVSKRYNALLV